MSKMDHSTKESNIALAPMLDFLNHTADAKVGYKKKHVEGSFKEDDAKFDKID